MLSQHIGDLSTVEARAQFSRTAGDQQRLFDIQPSAIACDLHPDYHSTQAAENLARSLDTPLLRVQHHHAHIAACMAEHGLERPVLGVAWDGAGYGPDGTIWGGEFLIADYANFSRVGQIRPFRLPGGEAAQREPRRAAFAMLYEIFADDVLALDLPPLASLGVERAQALLGLLKNMTASPVTTSMGRLFDGLSSILGLCQVSTFEAEAAMALEFCAEQGASNTLSYTFPIQQCVEGEPRIGKADAPSQLWIADWRSLVRSAVRDFQAGLSPATIAHAFHVALAGLIVRMAEIAKIPDVVLTGGVFQNMLLMESAQSRLSESGYRAYIHETVPPNDGGLSLGQAVVGAYTLKANKNSS